MIRIKNIRFYYDMHLSIYQASKSKPDQSFESVKAIPMLRVLSLPFVHGVSARPSLRDLLALHRQRSRLAELDTRMLRDIGVSPDEAMVEAARAPWDAPRHWRG